MSQLQAGIIPVTPFEQNCTVLFDPETMEGVIVDPGGDVEIILQTIKENDIKILGEPLPDHSKQEARWVQKLRKSLLLL